MGGCLVIEATEEEHAPNVNLLPATPGVDGESSESRDGQTGLVGCR